MKRSSMVVETVKDEPREDIDLERMECRHTQIYCIAAESLIEPPDASRPQEGLKSKTPKHPEILGSALRRTPHREAFIPDVKSWGGLQSWRRRQRTHREV
jgi:hypothetical protein